MTDILSLTDLKTASAYQIAVFEHVAAQIIAQSKGEKVKNLVVEATAGSGKTTTNVAMSNLFTRPSRKILTGTTAMRDLAVMYLAFNKPIADELQSRLKQGEAKTLNSLGWGIWRRYYETVNHGKKAQMVKGNKLRTIARNLYSYAERENYGDDVIFLAEKAISSGFAPSMTKLPAVGIDGKSDTDENLMGTSYHFGRAIAPKDRPTVFRMVRELLKAAFEDEGNCSFDDQKWFSVVKRTSIGTPINAFKYDAILVDEAQDLSPLDAALVKMVCKKNTITVFVGDREQSLYGFRGADARSIDNLIETFETAVLPLSITYRCGTRIVEEAKTVSNRIEARPNAHEGLVSELDAYDATIFQPNDKVVCRNNAPLVALAFKLIGAKVPVHMMGRDLGANLISVINKVCGRKGANGYEFGSKTVRDLVTGIQKWQAEQQVMILEADPDDEAAIQALSDRVATIMVFVQENTDGKITSVIASIRELFGTETFGAEKAPVGKVVLSSVHRAKGLEADRVFILNRSLFRPHWVKQGTWQYQQEINVEFVAITRAKNEIYYIELENYQ